MKQLAGGDVPAPAPNWRGAGWHHHAGAVGLGRVNGLKCPVRTNGWLHRLLRIYPTEIELCQLKRR